MGTWIIVRLEVKKREKKKKLREERSLKAEKQVLQKNFPWTRDKS